MGICSRFGYGGKPYIFLYSKSGQELSFKSINATKLHFHVKWERISNNLDTNNWVTLQGEEWLIQSTPRENK